MRSSLDCLSIDKNLACGIISKFKTLSARFSIRACQFSVLTLCAALVWPSARAEQPVAQVILLMDTSGSMKKSDPHFLRTDAARLFISLLTEWDQVGIVAFSTRSRLLAHPLRVTPTNRDLLLEAVSRVDSQGLHTNLHDALREGLEELSMLQRGEAVPMVILMTDGVMDSGDREQDRLLLEDIQAHLIPHYRDRGAKVHTVAFTDYSDSQLLSELAESTGGLFQVAHHSSELYRVFAHLFETIKQPEMLALQGNEFLVDPAIREITILMDKDTPEEKLYLQAPSGNKETYSSHSSNVKWLETPQFSMVAVSDPQSGSWNTVPNVESKRIYILANLRLMVRPSESTLSVNEPLVVEAWFEKDSNRITEPEILDKTLITARLSLPAESEQSQILVFNDQGQSGDRLADDGIFSMQFVPQWPGTYQLEVNAKSATFTRTRLLTCKVETAAPLINPKKSQDGVVTLINRTEPQVYSVSSKPSSSTSEPLLSVPKIQPSDDDDAKGTFQRLLMINLVVIACAILGYLAYRLVSRRSASRSKVEM
jgi:Mg-chelatase subunit ChlD